MNVEGKILFYSIQEKSFLHRHHHTLIIMFKCCTLLFSLFAIINNITFWLVRMAGGKKIVVVIFALLWNFTYLFYCFTNIFFIISREKVFHCSKISENNNFYSFKNCHSAIFVYFFLPLSFWKMNFKWLFSISLNIVTGGKRERGRR